MKSFIQLILGISVLGLNQAYGDFERPLRLAFPPLCEEHFMDETNHTKNTWLETCDRSAINEVSSYLHLIPKPYDADCRHCSCGGLALNRYNDIDYPLDDQTQAFQQIYNTHRHVNGRFIEVCENSHKGDHCETICWDGGYFRRLNHKYFPHFRHYLTYCDQNQECNCYWHEYSEQAVEINNRIYELFKDLARRELLLPEFSSFWTSKKIEFNPTGRFFGEDYYPDAHGMASSLSTYTFFFSQYHKVLLDVATFIDCNAVIGPASSEALDDIYSALEDMTDDFFEIYDNCLEDHPHPKIYYERGLLLMRIGKPLSALQDIQKLIALTNSEAFQNQAILNSEMYYQEGQAYADLGRYDQAIVALNNAIQLDPKNKDAYFRRANVYLEHGNFELAIDDYLRSGMKIGWRRRSDQASLEFYQAFLSSLKEGVKESAADFFPRVGQSIYGISQTFWVTVTHPKQALNNFVITSYRVGQYVAEQYANFDWTKFEEECSVEFRDFCDRYDVMTEEERGRHLGYIIGKYGVDIMGGGALIKGTKLVKEVELLKALKDSNRACHLEALIASETNKEALIANAVAHNLKRQKFFENVKIHWDSQNKHIPGKHNYDPKKSILEYSDPQTLINKFGGTGLSVRGTSGVPGYQEIIDFGTFIGYHISDANGKVPTTWGKIHYSKKGAHIVPTLPRVNK